MPKLKSFMAKRFRGFLPVVVDLETAGFNAHTDALLELAVITLAIDENQQFYPDQVYHEHIEPFAGANLEPEALAFTGINPYLALRFAVSERQALTTIFSAINEVVERQQCERAVLVGHNPWFDLSFLKAASEREKLKIPFHRFTTFDTASLSALVLGQTVLARACRKAGITFDSKQAHSALYDVERTAELFCYIVNQWKI